MNTLKEIKKENYEHFVSNHKMKSHFLQSYYWGEFSKEKKNLIPYYVGLVDEDDNIIASALLLKKELPLNFCYFYSPRGFVIDYSNEELLRDMTIQVKKFVKSKNGIFFKIDPDVIYRNHNYLNEEINDGIEGDKVLSQLQSLGFKHQGFTTDLASSQPRYTFRIDLNQDLETIESHFSKTTKQRIAKAKKLGCEVVIGKEEDLDEFYKLMVLTELRQNFVGHTEDYYESLYKIFKEKDMITLFLGKVTFDTVIKNLNNELKNVNTQISILPIDNLSKSAKNKLVELKKQKENINNDIKKYENYKKEHGDSLVLSAHIVVNYADKAWVLYASNHNILSETYANYITYYEHLKYCKEKGLKVYDQFGTIGDLRDDNPNIGLHEFKKKFGGNYIEFIGEFDYVTNKLMYFVFIKLIPIYRNFKRNKAKRGIVNEASGTK